MTSASVLKTSNSLSFETSIADKSLETVNPCKFELVCFELQCQENVYKRNYWSKHKSTRWPAVDVNEPKMLKITQVDNGWYKIFCNYKNYRIFHVKDPPEMFICGKIKICEQF